MLDASGAMDNRLHVIPFHVDFKKTPHKEQLATRRAVRAMLKDPLQISGIINDIIDTLRELVGNGFYLTKSVLSSKLKEEQKNINQLELGWLNDD